VGGIQHARQPEPSSKENKGPTLLNFCASPRPVLARFPENNLPMPDCFRPEETSCSRVATTGTLTASTTTRLCSILARWGLPPCHELPTTTPQARRYSALRLRGFLDIGPPLEFGAAGVPSCAAASIGSIAWLHELGVSNHLWVSAQIWHWMSYYSKAFDLILSGSARRVRGVARKRQGARTLRPTLSGKKRRAF